MYKECDAFFPPAALEQNMALLNSKTHSMAARHLMPLKGRSNSCSQTVSNAQNHTHCWHRNVLTTDAPHMLFLCSVNWAPSHKGSQRSVPEQVCKPNSGTWTYWALQEQAPQPLCEYTRSTSEDLHICFIMYFCNLAIYWCWISPFSPFLFSIDVACWLAD